MVSITIHDVPPEARNVLAARAARSGRSLQEYLHGQLVQLADRPDRDALLVRLRERVERDGVRLSPEDLLDAKDADRR